MTPRGACHADIRDVIERLNPILRGWSEYFRTGNAGKKFNDIDSYVWQRLCTLRVQRHGRNLRSGMTSKWTRAYFQDLGLLCIGDTINYPELA